MRPSHASLRLWLAVSAGSAYLGCSQSGSSGSGGNGQSSGRSGGIISSPSSSGGGLTQVSNATGIIGGAPSSATGGTIVATTAVGAGGSKFVATSQPSVGGSSIERSESGSAATMGGRSSFAEQGGSTTRTTGGTGMSNISGGTSAFGAGGSSSKGGQLGSAGGSATSSRGGAAGISGATGTSGNTYSTRAISFGTLLDAAAVIASAQQVAKSAANPSSPQWQSTGDQHRTYRFAEANADEPYRLCVPTTWDKKASLPLVMFLHGSGSTESTYLDQNNKQMISLAQKHGFVLVAPLGDQGAYGNFLRLSSPFGKPEEAAKLMAAVTADSERINQLSEKDVINVLELVLNEYPIDRRAVFLTGHSMGSGGTWYIGGKYATYWTGLAPMSGPFVQGSGYPWDSLRPISLLVTEGTQAPSLEGSRALRDWLSTNGFKFEYKEVNADHGGMVSLVLPDVFDFFDRSRGK